MGTEADRSKLVEVIVDAAPELTSEMAYRIADAIIDSGFHRHT